MPKLIRRVDDGGDSEDAAEKPEQALPTYGGNRFRGRAVRVEAAHAEEGWVSGIEYAPADGADVVGLLLMVPGSRGGLGPGLDRGARPHGVVLKRSGRGGIYPRLGQELSSGEEATWEYRRAPIRSVCNLRHHPAFKMRPGVRPLASPGSSNSVASVDFCAIASCDGELVDEPPQPHVANGARATRSPPFTRPQERQVNWRLPRSLWRAACAVVNKRCEVTVDEAEEQEQEQDLARKEEQQQGRDKEEEQSKLDGQESEQVGRRCAHGVGDDRQVSVASSGAADLKDALLEKATTLGSCESGDVVSQRVMLGTSHSMPSLEAQRVVPSSTKCNRQSRSWGLASLQIEWSRCPEGELRRVDMLESAVADIEAASWWLLRRYPGRPLVFVCHSFGGPSVWAAMRRLPSTVPLAGAVSMAGSARGGERFARLEMSTADCVRHFSKRRLRQIQESSTVASSSENQPSPAVLFFHGTHDQKVAIDVSEFLYESACGPKTLVSVNHATHNFDTTRDTAYPVLRSWVVAVVERWHRIVTSPPHVGVSCVGAVGGSTVCLDAGKLHIGYPLRLQEHESLGEEKWRLPRTADRFYRACHGTAEDTEAHQLAGLLGYSE